MRKRHLIVVGMILGGVLLLGKGVWIHTKALLAQHLIAASWSRTLSGEHDVKPWAWADTWPVARLMSERQGVDLYVLSGANGSALAFGPGHYRGTAMPGSIGNSVIAGHRDTHFRFLQRVQNDELLQIETIEGELRHYRITGKRIADSRSESLNVDPELDRLTLVTCYPFDAIDAGGPLRMVVTAEAL